jgi:lipoate-protein ligase B
MENKILDLGLVDYPKALKLQKDNFELIKSGSLKSVLLFCRHYPVITLGRRASLNNIIVDMSILSSRGIAVYPVERGGDVTYHGPGQLVVYPLIHLKAFKKDIHFFLRRLEQTVMMVLSEFGIQACLKPGLTGVWVGERKICSIGITVRNWISYHGLALNISKKDLANFSLIKPCGMDIEMTSMETVLNKEICFIDVQRTFIRRFEYA